MLVYCFGSFLLQDMLSLLVFAFERQYKEFTVNELLNLLSKLTPGSALIRTVFKYRFLSRVIFAFIRFSSETRKCWISFHPSRLSFS